ncbi:MAG: hypothetical protein Q7S39_06545 [Ignavibacteria bacterium]|nr:hypothetical protein [Ignavibacteria bacterium]
MERKKIERKKIEALLVKSLQRIIGLSGGCKIQRDYELKIKKIECLLFEVDYILSEFEEFEKPKDPDII